MKIFIDTEESSYAEYLVNYSYLDIILKEYGFERVKVEELSVYYKRMGEIPENIREISTLTDEMKLTTFMYNSFIYEKVVNSSEKIYQKLRKMI